MNTLNESTKSLNTMTEVQEEQIQGGLKSALLNSNRQCNSVEFIVS